MRWVKVKLKWWNVVSKFYWITEQPKPHWICLSINSPLGEKFNTLNNLLTRSKDINPWNVGALLSKVKKNHLLKSNKLLFLKFLIYHWSGHFNLLYLLILLKNEWWVRLINSMFQGKINNQIGFALFEIMLVILMIGIIVTMVVLPTMIKIDKSTRELAIRQLIQSLCYKI